MLLRGACVHHDNGPIGAATIDRAEERRVELLKAAGLQRHPQRAQPDEPGDARRLRPARDARHGRDVRHVDRAEDRPTTTPCASPTGGRPTSRPWSARTSTTRASSSTASATRSPTARTPDGPAASAARSPRRCARSTTPASSPRRSAACSSPVPTLFDEIRAAAESTVTDEETGVNTALDEPRRPDGPRRCDRTVVTENTTEAFSYLDVAGYNYMDARFEMDGERFPNRVIVVDRDVSVVSDRPRMGRRHRQRPRDRRLHLDGLGLPRRGRHRPRRVRRPKPGRRGMRSFHGDYPWLTAWCGDIDITGHRRPQSYYREIVFGLRTDPYLAVQRPEHHGRSSSTPARGRGATWSRAGAGTATRAAAVMVEVYADADEVELLVNGTSHRPAPAGDEHRFRAEFDTAYDPGQLEAVAWRGGEEVGRTQPAVGDRPRCCSPCAPTDRRSAPTPPTWRSSSSPWSTSRVRSGPRPTGG